MKYLDDKEPIQCLVPIMKKINYIMGILYPKLEATDKSLLCSKPSKMKQAIHCDFYLKQENKVLFVDNDNPPLGVLVALQHDTKLLVYPKSHTLIWKIVDVISGNSTCKNLHAIQGVTISIPKNSFCVFRQDLVHAGEAYDIKHLRFHIYFDRIGATGVLKRNHDDTFLIEKLHKSAVKFFTHETDENDNNSMKQKPNKRNRISLQQ